MNNRKAVVVGLILPGIEIETAVLSEAGCRLEVAPDAPGPAFAEAVADADALLVQKSTVPIDAAFLGALRRCKIIVRCGVGIDNVDVAAAAACGIAVSNVPDYAADEVADHAFALALSLGRQLPQLDASLRAGVWSLEPPAPMPAFREMTFAVAGYGRIGRGVLERARACNFRLAAYDPFVDSGVMAERGVDKCTLDELIPRADVLSLHLPLTSETRHAVDAARLRQLKRGAILVNTARGALVDTLALAEALRTGGIAAAGLDVFEDEPLPADHPLRACPNALLTSHMAWHSSSSTPTLQRMAAEEVVRALRGEPLRSQVASAGHK